MAEPTTGATTATGKDGGTAWRRAWSRVVDRGQLWFLLELFVLTGFVIAQPLLDITGKAPDFFIFRRADRADMLLLIAIVTLLPALALWVVELIAALAGAAVRQIAHVVIVTWLLAVLALEVGKKLLPLRGSVLVLVAAAVALAVGFLYVKQRWLRLWLRYLAPAPLVFVLLFATVSPSAKLLLPASAPAGPGGPVASAANRPPIVMVFFDEFPLESLLDSKGQVDPNVYPNFAKVAAGSTWFRNATGVSGYTPWAMPAMLTGQYPRKAKAPIDAEYPDNLFTLFGRAYNLKVKETITQLCPAQRCGQSGSPDAGGMGKILADTAGLWKNVASPYDVAADPASFADTQTSEAAGADRNAADRATDVLPEFQFGKVGHTNEPGRWNEFLDSIRASDRQPSLYFLHVLMPHSPWHYLPSGATYPYRGFSGNGMQDDRDYGPGIYDQNHERHLLQLAYADRLIGQLIQRLKDQGLYDKSLLMLTADHGDGFTVGNKARGLGDRNAHELMWVPMFIKSPGQTAGRVDDRNWEQVDLLPTLANMVGITVPWRTDGFSQTGAPARQRTQKYWYGIPGNRQVQDGPPAFQTVLHGVTDTLVRGSQEGQRGLYRYGATADWIYKSPQEVGQVAPAAPGLRAKIDNWDDAFKTIDPASGTVPAFVYGRMESGPPPPGAKLAVAINGQIGGVNSFFYDAPGGKADKFAAVVPDFLYHPGPGQPQVQLYLVQQAGGRPQFQPISIVE
jgi:sulfatase-like protein